MKYVKTREGSDAQNGAGNFNSKLKEKIVASEVKS
jgi:hypothetical protein